jgi:hypothetical protein
MLEMYRRITEAAIAVEVVAAALILTLETNEPSVASAVNIRKMSVATVPTPSDRVRPTFPVNVPKATPGIRE